MCCKYLLILWLSFHSVAFCDEKFIILIYTHLLNFSTIVTAFYVLFKYPDIKILSYSVFIVLPFTFKFIITQDWFLCTLWSRGNDKFCFTFLFCFHTQLFWSRYPGRKDCVCPSRSAVSPLSKISVHVPVGLFLDHSPLVYLSVCPSRPVWLTTAL